MTSPTKRTIDELEKRGYVVDIAERRISRKVTKDLFGFIDIVALWPHPFTRHTIGVQATDGSHHSKRRRKIIAEPRARAWIKAGGRIEVWSWRENAKGVWVPRVEEITVEILDA